MTNKQEKITKKRCYAYAIKLFAGSVFGSVFMSMTQAEEIDLYSLSLHELLNVQVTVSSHFTETKLTSGATTELFTSDDWQQSGARTVWDAINHQPGMYLPQNTVGQKAISLRGFAISPGTRGVAILVDGVSINNISYSTGLYHLENIGLGALDSIEMIRGPGSALYGADAFHGVLSLSIPKYNNQDKIEIHGTGGSGDYAQVSLKIAQRLSENLTFNVALDHREDHSKIQAVYVNGVSSFDSNKQFNNNIEELLKTASLVSSLLFESSAKLKIDASVIFNDHERETVRYVRDGFPEMVPQESSFALYKVELDYELPANLILESKLYRWTTDWFWDFTNPSSVPFRFTQDETKTGFDVHVKQEVNGLNTNWVLGYTRSNAKLDKSRNGPNDSPLNIVNIEGYKRNLNSVYFESRTSFSDKFDLLLGVRYDDYSDSGNHISPRIGLIYYPNNQSAFKILYGNAFRSPAANEIGISSAPGKSNLFGNADISPETIDTYEFVYVRTEDNKSLEITLFRTELDDGIILTQMPSSDSRYVAGNAHRTYFNEVDGSSVGIETKFGIGWQNVEFDFNISWVKGKNKRLGFDYDAFPEWIGNTELSYKFDDHRTSISLNYRFELDKKTFQRSLLNQQSSDLKNYYRTDLNITKRYGDQIELSLNIVNLFDNNSLYSGTLFPHETLINEPGINAMLKARYTF